MGVSVREAAAASRPHMLPLTCGCYEAAAQLRETKCVLGCEAE